ncbi:MAG: hypothetical protein AB8E15_07855 [Bdellovibrionales bacterium]
MIKIIYLLIPLMTFTVNARELLYECYAFGSEAMPEALVFEKRGERENQYAIEIFIPNNMDNVDEGVGYSYIPEYQEYLTLADYGLRTKQPHFNFELSGLTQLIPFGSTLGYKYSKLTLNSRLHEIKNLECFKGNAPSCSTKVIVDDSGDKTKVYTGVETCG